MLRRGAVAGWGRWRCDAVYPSRRSKPRLVRRACRTLGPPDGPVGRLHACQGMRPSWPGLAGGVSWHLYLMQRTNGSTTETKRGANLTNTARGAPGIRQLRGDLLV